VAAARPLDADGWHHVAIPIESIEVAVGDLLRLGPDVEALGPPALLAALREALAKLHAVYGGNRTRSKKS
jgi:predicted DNA-binding transcriptional regulator YafY